MTSTAHNYSESDESESGPNNLECVELDLESSELELSTDGAALNLPSHLPSSEPLASSTESDGHCERNQGILGVVMQQNIHRIASILH